MSVYPRILVAVDGSAAATRGLREALRLAKDMKSELFIVHVVNEFYVYATMEAAWAAPDPGAALRKEGERLLEKAKALAAKQGVRAKTVLRHIPSGPAADAILREARKLRAALIVLGTHGRRGLRRLVLGSDAELVVRDARVPVLLVRAAA